MCEIFYEVWIHKRPSFCYWEQSIYINPLLDNGRYLDWILKVLLATHKYENNYPSSAETSIFPKKMIPELLGKYTAPLPVPVSIILLPTGTGPGSGHSPKKPVSAGKQMANSSAQVLESVSLDSNPSSVACYLCNLGRHLNNSVPSPLHLRFRLIVPLKGFLWELN